MEQWQQFFFMMASLSAAAQTVTEHLFKKRFRNELGTPTVGKAEDRRQSLLHLVCAVVGIALTATTDVHPLRIIVGANSLIQNGVLGTIVEYALIGAMVSYGGGFFNDLLGVMQAFQAARKQVEGAAAQLQAAQPTAAQLQAAQRPVAQLEGNQDDASNEDDDPFDISYFDDAESA